MQGTIKTGAEWTVFQKDPLQKTIIVVHIPLSCMLLAARFYDRRGEERKTAAVNGSRI